MRADQGFCFGAALLVALGASASSRAENLEPRQWSIRFEKAVDRIAPTLRTLDEGQIRPLMMEFVVLSGQVGAMKLPTRGQCAMAATEYRNVLDDALRNKSGLDSSVRAAAAAALDCKSGLPDAP